MIKDIRAKMFDVWFALCCGVGNRDFPYLLERYGDAYTLYRVEGAELEALPCSPRVKERLANKSLDEATAVIGKCMEHGINILYWQDEDYPQSLRTLQDPPVLLYYKGTLPDFSERLCVGVVGTRRMSEYGKRMAYRIGYELGAAGAIVVSGLALGIDGVAAAATLLAEGTTVAVLACGLDKPYPSQHQQLFDEIVEKGVVMSEFPPETPPDRWQFPTRNRIISGLSQATVVVEAPQRSGALITARDAILQGREIYAFPGNVGEFSSKGSNQLLNDGAAMILNARDLLVNYLYLYEDNLDMDRLEWAESRKRMDEEYLVRLGVCAPSVKSRRYAPPMEPPVPLPMEAYQEAPPVPREMPEDDIPPPPEPPKVSKSSKSPKSAPKPQSVPARGDASAAALTSLTDTQRRIFEALPLDHAVTIDYLTREGFTVGEITAAMTVLEIKGLTVTLPGALFSRK